MERRRGVLRELPVLVERLRRGEPNVPLTARACSRYYGQRCLPDVAFFTLRREGAVPTREVTILEDKKEFRPTYMLQLYAIGIIFTDFRVMVQRVPTGEPRADLDHEFMENGVFLYDHLMRELGLPEMRVEVYIPLNAYGDVDDPVDQPIFRSLFSRDFKIVPDMERQFLNARKKPYLLPFAQTHFTTRPRRRARVVRRLDEKYALYLPST